MPRYLGRGGHGFWLTNPAPIIFTKSPLGFQHIYKLIFLPSSLAISHSSLFFSQPSLPHLVTHTVASLSRSPSRCSLSLHHSIFLPLSPSLYFHHRPSNICFIVLTNPLLLFIFCFVLFLSNAQISQTHAHTKFRDFDKSDLGVSSFLGSLTLKWPYKLQNIKNENEKSWNLQLLCYFSSSPLLLLSSSSFLVLSTSLCFFFSCFVCHLLPFQLFFNSSSFFLFFLI